MTEAQKLLTAAVGDTTAAFSLKTKSQLSAQAANIAALEAKSKSAEDAYAKAEADFKHQTARRERLRKNTSKLSRDEFKEVGSGALDRDIATAAATMEVMEQRYDDLAPAIRKARAEQAAFIKETADALAPQGPVLDGPKKPKRKIDQNARDFVSNEAVALMSLEAAGLKAEIEGLQAAANGGAEAGDGTSIFSNFTVGLDGVATAAQQTTDGISALIEKATELDFAQQQKDAALLSGSLRSMADSTIATGSAFVGAAIHAALYGESVKAAVNAEAQTKFYAAMLTMGELAFQIPLDLAFGGLRTPLLLKSLAGATAQLALAGAVAGATGGLKGGLGAPSAPSGGGSVGAGGASPPERDPYRDEPEQTETVFNVNLVAQSESPRQDAHSAAIGIQDIFRVAGLTLGGG
jgi:hypothetical protein